LRGDADEELGASPNVDVENGKVMVLRPPLSTLARASS